MICPAREEEKRENISVLNILNILKIGF